MADESILAEADRLIHGERHTVYGDATADFTKTANLWNAVLGVGDVLNKPLGPKHVALMMALLKISRESHQHKRDNNVDACGYIALGHDISEKTPTVVYEEIGQVSPFTGHQWRTVSDSPPVCVRCNRTAFDCDWVCPIENASRVGI